MQKATVVLLLIVILTVNACGNKENGKSIISELQLTSIVELEENNWQISNMSSLNFIDDNNIVISTVRPSGVYIYNLDGKQIRQLGRVGHAAFEYINASIVKVYDEEIYVWCDRLLKLLVFDKNGKNINEFSNFRRAIRDFEIIGKNIYLYQSGGFSDAIVLEYNLKTDKLINEFGSLTQEHELLSLMSGSGGMTRFDSKLFFCRADALDIYCYNTAKSKLEIKHILDDDFKISKLELNASMLINTDRNKALEYIYNNSVVKSLHKYDDGFVVKAEIGEYEIKDKGLNSDNRFDMYVYLNLKNDSISQFTTLHNSNINDNLTTCYKGKFYTVVNKIEDVNIRYELKSFQLNDIK